MYHHTRNRLAYTARIAILAIVSEPIYEHYFGLRGNACIGLTIGAALLAANAMPRVSTLLNLIILPTLAARWAKFT